MSKQLYIFSTDSPGNHTNGRSICSAGKHWLVYEYVKITEDQRKNASEVREQFALEHKDHDTVIYSIYANVTAKVIKTTNSTKSQFHEMLKKNGKDYKILGKIREGESSHMYIINRRLRDEASLVKNVSREMMHFLTHLTAEIRHKQTFVTAENE